MPYFVAHGKPESNIKGRFHSHCDIFSMSPFAAFCRVPTLNPLSYRFFKVSTPILSKIRGVKDYPNEDGKTKSAIGGQSSETPNASLILYSCLLRWR